jgi:uncharacterized membrane protein YfcA
MEMLIGFSIAVVIALTGVGAGVVTAPVLILALHLPVEAAVTAALAYSAIVKLIVVPIQVARRQVNFKILGYMLLGGLPGVIAGSALFRRVAAHGSESILYAVLGAIITFSAAWHLFRHFSPASIVRPAAERPGWIALIMLPIGAEVGFSSSGAGALGTLALLSLSPLSASQVVGTDLAFGLAIALAGSGFHLAGGMEPGSLALLAKLAVGGVFGGVLGSGVAPRIPNRRLRLILSVWLVILGIEFCFQAARFATRIPRTDRLHEQASRERPSIHRSAAAPGRLMAR